MRNLKWFAVFFVILFIFSACDSSKKVRIGGVADDEPADLDTSADTETDSEETDDPQKDDIFSDSDDSGNTGDDNAPSDSDSGNTGDTGNTGDDNVSSDEDTALPPDCKEDGDCSSLDGECVKGSCNNGKCEAENRPPETLCNDGVFCNGDDACNNSGECISGDSYPCGENFCSESGGVCCEGGFAGSDCSVCVRFVAPVVSTVSDGLSWSTAFSSVADAVASAGSAVSSGDVTSCEVWAAQGNYPVIATISMVSNVSVKGGFSGAFDARSSDASLTVLDGSATALDNIISAISVLSATVDGLKIYGNVNNGSQANYGGGMYIEGASAFTINNVIFESNSAIGQTTSSEGYEAKGGALAVVESDVAISGCLFTGNKVENGSDDGAGSSSAGSFGGAVYISAGSVTLSNCRFENNQATQAENGSASGGAVFAYMPVSLVLTDNTFNTNYSENWGGGVRVEGGNVTFTGNVFSGNSAGNNGGGVEFNNVTSASFSGNTFSANTAGTGGGVHVSNKTNATFDGDLFTSNEATVFGAGLSVVNSTAQVQNSRFSSNNCKGGNECRGGAIALDVDATGTIVNSLIYKNNAKNYGGGLYTRDGSTANLVFSTLADNTTGSSCSNTGSGIHNYDSGTTNIIDSIVHGNTPCNQTQNNTNSKTNVSYSLFQGGYAGTGNINGDPLFVDRANNDYHLNTGSPCIDTALTDAANPAADLEKKTRPAGAGYDMGCFEF